MGISALLAAQILDASATGRSVLTGADASAIRTTLGLGTLATQSPTGTPSASTFLRGDFSWQTIDLSGYLQLTGGTMTGQLAITQATANTSVLTSTGYSLTGSNAQSLIDVAGTWNTTGTPTLIKANVTDTASNANSLLMDLQVGGSSRFKVGKDGHIYGGSTVVGISNSIVLNAASTYTMVYSANVAISDNGSFRNVWIRPSTSGTGEFLLAGGMLLGWSDSNGNAATATDLVLRRDAANTLAQRNSTNAQTFRIYNTFTDASNYERAKIAWESNVLRIGTEKAGTGSARALELQTDGTTRLTIGTDGKVRVGAVPVVQNQFTVTASNTIGGLMILQNTSSTGYASFDTFDSSNAQVMGFGYGNASAGVSNLQSRAYLYSNAKDIVFSKDIGTTISLAINGTTGNIGIGTASPSTLLHVAGETTLGGNVTISAVNLVTDTTTGTKIGTATTQKLGFYDKTPVVQPTAVADATDAASVITQLNALLSRMRDLGLIAT